LRVMKTEQEMKQELGMKNLAQDLVKQAEADAGITFVVDENIEVSEEALKDQPTKAAVEKLLGGPVEACDNYTSKVLVREGFNALVEAADIAYSRHLPLALDPNHVWLTIAQGLALHVNNNAEELRDRFVTHEGKELIEVFRNDFIKGSPENPWEDVFEVFSEKIRRRTQPGIADLVECDFSTTTPTDVAASQIVLMNAVQSYFSYQFTTMCGIPKVTVQGTKGDWQKIMDRVNRLDEYGLDWWTPGLRTVVIMIMNVFDGTIETEFWKNFYKEHGGSGGPYVGGWINQLFPYIKARDRQTGEAHFRDKNPSVIEPDSEKGFFGGLTHGNYPASHCTAPFVWNYHGAKHDYEFIGGLTGVEQRPGGGVRPKVGWAVRERKAA
jgi:hypothetical protein